MERIDIRVHDEIVNVAERYSGFTIRQWIFGVLIAVVVIPTWFILQPILGDDTTSWIVIVEAVPIVFIGFIPVQEMSAEKIVPYWIRHYLKLAKPLEYKTDKQIEEEKNAKKSKGKHRSTKAKSVQKKKTGRKEKRIFVQEEKKKRRELKKQRREQRELAKAKKKYESERDFEFDESKLNEQDIQSIIRLGKLLEGREVYSKNEKEETSKTDRNTFEEQATEGK